MKKIIIFLIFVINSTSYAQLKNFNDGEFIKKEEFNYNINYLNSLLVERNKNIQLPQISSLNAVELNNILNLLIDDSNLNQNQLISGNLISSNGVNNYFLSMKNSIESFFSYQECNISNGVGQQFYSNGVWESCIVNTCNNNFKIINNSCYYYSNCQEYYDNGTTSSGSYWIDPDGDGLNPPLDVYCDMNNPNGKINIVKKTNYGNQNINVLFDSTDKKQVYMYSMNTSSLRYGKLSQISYWQTTPINLNQNDTNTVSFQFAQFSGSPQGIPNGVKVNNFENSFTNCDTNPSSYIRFERNLSSSPFATAYQWSSDLVNYSTLYSFSELLNNGGGLTINVGGCGAASNDKNMESQTGYTNFLFGI